MFFAVRAALARAFLSALRAARLLLPPIVPPSWGLPAKVACAQSFPGRFADRATSTVVLLMAFTFLLGITPAQATDVDVRYWLGSQTATWQTVEIGSPWVLRYQQISGTYFADKAGIWQTTRWSADLGWTVGSNILYVGYSSLNHVSAAGGSTWNPRLYGAVLGVRSPNASGLTYDIAVKPSTTYTFSTWTSTEWGFDADIGFSYVSPDTHIRAGFAEWWWAAAGGELVWSGPYLSLTFKLE